MGSYVSCRWCPFQLFYQDIGLIDEKWLERITALETDKLANQLYNVMRQILAIAKYRQIQNQLLVT